MPPLAERPVGRPRPARFVVGDLNLLERIPLNCSNCP